MKIREIGKGLRELNAANIPLRYNLEQMKGQTRTQTRWRWRWQRHDRGAHSITSAKGIASIHKTKWTHQHYAYQHLALSNFEKLQLCMEWNYSGRNVSYIINGVLCQMNVLTCSFWFSLSLSLFLHPRQLFGFACCRAKMPCTINRLKNCSVCVWVWKPAKCTERKRSLTQLYPI